MDNISGLTQATALLTSKNRQSRTIKNNKNVDKAYSELKKQGFDVKEINLLKVKYNNKTIEELKKMRKQLDIIVENQ